MTTKLLLAEKPYQALQGEGRYVGTPMIFLRLMGCDVGCVWCDSKYTWGQYNQEKVPKQIRESVTPISAELEQVCQMIDNAGRAQHIWITGGEPTLQAPAIVDLIEYYKRTRGGKMFHICTAGTIFNRELAYCIDAITIDVKAPLSKAHSNIETIYQFMECNTNVELKMVVANHDHDKDFARQIADEFYSTRLTLQPLYYSEDAVSAGASVDGLVGWTLADFERWFNKQFGDSNNVKMGLQLHKHLHPNQQRGI